jgi:hypothetical protein
VAEAGYCTRCGFRLQAEDRFCGRCGAQARATSADEPTALTDPVETLPPAGEPEEDLLVEWGLDLPEPTPDAAPTEAIALPASAPTDTAVLTPAPDPYQRPDGQAPAPAEPPAAAPGRTPQAPAGRAQPFPWGASFALLGAVAVIVSSILPWEGPFEGSLPRDIPVRLLIDPDGPSSGISLGMILLFLGTVGALMALVTMAVPSLKFVRRLVGLITLSIPAVFVLRTIDPLLAAGEIGQLPSALGAGVYTAVAGSLVLLLAGKWFTR